MNERNIKRLVRGRRTSDGAGVRLVRVLANDTVEDFDPFLMLDSFDSTDSADYIAGFPMHPHRGIETITYLLAGRIDHEDSLGNKGSIRDGESQWMASGNGILHQEMPQPSERMLGFQLWLNMPRSEKMSHPSYLSITPHMIGRMHSGGAKLGVLSGRYGDTQGVTPGHIQATLIDVDLPKGESVKLDIKAGETVFVFLLKGDAQIGGQAIAEKSAVLFGDGDYIQVSAMPNQDLRFMVFSGKPLHEPVAWGGPIVMNTRAELDLAFQELREGTFIKHG